MGANTDGMRSRASSGEGFLGSDGALFFEPFSFFPGSTFFEALVSGGGTLLDFEEPFAGLAGGWGAISGSAPLIFFFFDFSGSTEGFTSSGRAFSAPLAGFADPFSSRVGGAFFASFGSLFGSALVFSTLPFSGLAFSTLAFSTLAFSGLAFSGLAFSGLPFSGRALSALAFSGLVFSTRALSAFDFSTFTFSGLLFSTRDFSAFDGFVAFAALVGFVSFFFSIFDDFDDLATFFELGFALVVTFERDDFFVSAARGLALPFAFEGFEAPRALERFFSSREGFFAAVGFAFFVALIGFFALALLAFFVGFAGFDLDDLDAFAPFVGREGRLGFSAFFGLDGFVAFFDFTFADFADAFGFAFALPLFVDALLAERFGAEALLAFTGFFFAGPAPAPFFAEFFLRAPALFADAFFEEGFLGFLLRTAIEPRQ